MSLNPLTAIASVLTLAPKLIRGVAALINAVRGRPPPPPAPPKPIPYNRPHAWGYGLNEPPRCAVCKLERTAENAELMCDGPPPAAAPPPPPPRGAG